MIFIWPAFLLFASLGESNLRKMKPVSVIEVYICKFSHSLFLLRVQEGSFYSESIEKMHFESTIFA